jgi:hypothetical protein
VPKEQDQQDWLQAQQFWAELQVLQQYWVPRQRVQRRQAQ